MILKLKGKYYQFSCSKILYLKDIRQEKIFPIMQFIFSLGPRASTSVSDPLKCATVSPQDNFFKKGNRKSEL